MYSQHVYVLYILPGILCAVVNEGNLSNKMLSSINQRCRKHFSIPILNFSDLELLELFKSEIEIASVFFI